ncbi:MAG TPA: DUF3592 domain-containing protein [Actinomycetales bacterium]|nr:DUF3592 domain-containing protein [Actinomycetales bacterium]
MPLVALVVTEMALESDACSPVAPCRFPLSSMAYHVAPVAELLAIGSVLLALLLPRAAVWVAALAAALLTGPASPDSSVPALWPWALVWFGCVGAADLLGRWRQLVESHTWNAPTFPFPDPGPDPSARPGLPDRLARDEDTRLLSLLVAGVGLAVFVGMLLWHLQATSTVRDVEAHALRTEAAVTAVGSDGYSVTLRVEGRDVQLDTLGTYAVGDRVPVLVDAADPGHVALVAEPEDPSWRIGVGALALAVLLSVAGRLWSRGSRRSALARHGGPAVRLRVGRQRSRLLLTTLDDRDFARPLSMVRDVGPSSLLLPLDRAEAHVAEDDAFDDELEGELDVEPPDVSTLSDSELAAWADREVEAFGELDEDDIPAPPDLPLAVDGGLPVTVVGLRRDGDPVLLMLDDGATLASLGGSRDPWSWPALKDRALGVRTRVRGPGATRRERGPSPYRSRPEKARRERRRDAILARALAVVSPFGPALACALALSAYPAARWLLDGEAGWAELFPIAFGGFPLAEALVFLAGLNRPPLDSRPGALLHRGRWFDELLPVERIQAVTPGRSAVVLRLTDPSDALALPPQAVVRYADHLAAPEATPEQAAFAVEQLLRVTTPSGRRGWRRPSPTLVPGALLMIGLLAAWGQAKFG